jgi:hypothetical protein
MRREFIYPHRSVRFLPVSRVRMIIAFGMAILLSGAVLYFGASLIGAHEQLSGFILRQTQIPSAGMATAAIFPRLGSITVPNIPFPNNRANPLRTALFFAATVIVLTVIHRTVPLSRNFIVFLLVLLCAAGAVILLTHSFEFNSVTYEQIWLRGEVLVWLVLPWVSAFLFVLTLPSLLGGVAWTLLLQVYAVVWSAIRLAFCLGVLHFTGILFLPLLWFCLGVLFDLVYILVFYSFALRLSITRVIGVRAS